jgi:hypothetical protein
MCATYVWSKAPIGCKKYPAVAGYLMKMEQSSTKGLIKGGPGWPDNDGMMDTLNDAISKKRTYFG